MLACWRTVSALLLRKKSSYASGFVTRTRGQTSALGLLNKFQALIFLAVEKMKLGRCPSVVSIGKHGT